jgi:F0F1-type ATP synthase assembly protein I
MSIFGGKREDFRKLAEMSSVAMILPSSIAVGLFFGYILDKWLHTAPWMLLIFLIFGIASGLWSLYRAMKKYM